MIFDIALHSLALSQCIIEMIKLPSNVSASCKNELGKGKSNMLSGLPTKTFGRFFLLKNNINVGKGTFD